MRGKFEPLNALLFLCMGSVGWVFSREVRKAFRPVVTSKRSLIVKLRFLSKWFDKQVPYLAPCVAAVAALFYCALGLWGAVGVIGFVCMIPLLVKTPSEL